MHQPGFRDVAGGALLALLALGYVARSAQTAPANAGGTHSAAAPAEAAAAAAAGAVAGVLSPVVPPIVAPMSASRVIEVLDQTVDWYRTLGIQQQAANEPSDLLILYDNRQTANKIMGLAFDIARADADMLDEKPTPLDDADAGAALSSQSLRQLETKFDAQLAAVQAELDAQRRLLHGASKKSAIEVQAKINELQGELDLAATKKSILATFAGFSAGADGTNVTALKSQIDAMAVVMPANAAGAPATSSPASAGAPPVSALLGAPIVPPTVGRFGLWDLGANVLRLSEKAATTASIDRRTAALQATLQQVRTPLIDEIKALSARGDALAAQAGSADSTTLNNIRGQLDAFATQFKQASALLIPLSKEAILLAQYRRNLSNWSDAIKTQYRDAIKTLGIRCGVLLVILGLLFGGAELWQRTVLRYIQDSRRRYQLLLLRQIALWSLVIVVIGMAFASELGSIVTFAGLITAGIAVAMQSVLVSIVGYFFLIGKYGIRVGDRVQIGEVAGEVIDLGLVRMYLMELGGRGALGPTGRVVAFANSVVFQVSSGLFKQIPGVDFSWRELTFNLPAVADYAAIKEKLVAAMIDALKDYRPEIVRQIQEIARTTSSSAGDTEPQVQLHFAVTGVEAQVRYPVHLGHAAEIDERVTEALAKVMSSIPAVAAGALPAPR